MTMQNEISKPTDAEIFNLLAKNLPRKQTYKYHDSIKKNKYKQRKIDVEEATFCPLVFVFTGGAAHQLQKR